MEYEIEIVETSVRKVKVDAEQEVEALQSVMQMYKDEEIVLDEDDFVGVEIRKVQT